MAAEWHVIQRCLLPEDPQRAVLYTRGGVPASRTSVQAAPGQTVSFATYFGAFPAAYWAAHTGVRRVRASVVVDGEATVTLRRTDAAGRASARASVSVAGGRATLDASCDAGTGWMWLEITAGDAAVTVGDAVWETSDAPASAVTVTVAITTFDRETDCVRLLDRLAGDDLRARVGLVVVADQGTRPLRRDPGFAAVAARLGERLRVIEQPNLGGSGGFSRGMVEALGAEGSHVLLLDDDVDLEPESLHRAARFAEHARTPVIVGAQMLSLVEPAVLHSFGERISRRGFWWEPVDPSLSTLDLATATIENTPALSRRVDVDFNGWWMCLVPVPLVRTAGASLPLFIKWDDAEFGLRAADAGVGTVSLPGAALWHMPWTAKDDGLDWQAYFQLRNRIVAALLHGGRRGGGVLTSSFRQDVNHLLCAQYGSVRVRNQALLDILDGPSHLEETLRQGPARPARLLARAGQAVVPEAQLPAARRISPVRPRGPRSAVGRIARVILHQLRAPRPTPDPVRLARTDGKWWSLGALDAAVVDAAAGRGAFVVRRDRSEMWRGLRNASRLRLRMWLAWPRLARRYRAEAPALASPAAWQRRFAMSTDAHP
ncbi:glycosyltransferase [Microbacterium sp. E-13]|uniref:glycosyltransferase n=1 Tax=Microbacterium sp. E-13 TaxID=3404048 RepID=UPI003CEDBD33